MNIIHTHYECEVIYQVQVIIAISLFIFRRKKSTREISSADLGEKFDIFDSLEIKQPSICVDWRHQPFPVPCYNYNRIQTNPIYVY